jgi:hypothetical protein
VGSDEHALSATPTRAQARDASSPGFLIVTQLRFARATTTAPAFRHDPFKFGPVTFPAYEGATAGVSSLTDWWLEAA